MLPAMVIQPVFEYHLNWELISSKKTHLIAAAADNLFF